MAEIKRASYAFAGSGEVDDGNAAALLDDELPQALGAVYRPTRVPRSNKSLSAVIDWLESKDVLGPKGTVPSDDLIADLLSRRDEGDDVVLVVIWPDEPGEDELALAKAAFENGIRVKNLAAALDDLLQDTVFPPPPAEPEAEAEAAPEAPAETAPAGDIQDDIARAVVAGMDGVAQQLAHNFTETLELFVRRIVRDELAKANGKAEAPAPAAAKAPAATKEKATRAPARGRAAGRPPAGAEEIEDGPKGPPPVRFSGGDKAPDATPTTDYYVNQDGKYRVAKTRPRKGEERVALTLGQAQELQEKGLITD